MDPFTIALIVALGLVVGAIVGLTSVGSGALMTPILYLDFASSLAHNLVVGTATTQGTVTKFVASARNYLRGKLSRDYTFMIAITGVPLAVVGAFFSSRFVAFNLFPPFLALVLLFVGVGIVLQLRANKMNHKEDPKLTLRLKRKGMLVGAGIGLIAGLTGVSTGSLLVSSLIILLKFPNRTAVTIAIFEGGLILLAATATQLYLGNVNLPFTGLLVIGGIPGVLIGSHFKDRIDQSMLGYGIAVVIIFESLRTLSSFLFGKSFFFF
ncbi:MAG: sulfite exporter TauE/SafE family protein [Candidatus Micrarchaeota archaeon]|nr:sulfite exporter TauE/SafE family protein [Candidatus Micrarchaeota archaeon]